MSVLVVGLVGVVVCPVLVVQVVLGFECSEFGSEGIEDLVAGWALADEFPKVDCCVPVELEADSVVDFEFSWAAWWKRRALLSVAWPGSGSVVWTAVLSVAESNVVVDEVSHGTSS